MNRHGHYLHQQMAWPMLLVLLAVATITYTAFASTGWAIAGLLVLLFPIVVAFLFGSMVVEVDRDEVRLRFGVGLIRRRWATRDIATAEAVRNPWYTGWGIRWLPGRTVYNVAGFGAVEITLHNGKRYRIGTDEPRELENAIRTRVNAVRR